MPGACHIETFTDYAASARRALAAIDAAPVLARQTQILIKPNLVNASPPPVTLPVEMVRALVAAIREMAPSARIVVAEGCGDPRLATDEIFRRLGYDRLARELDVPLIDLNATPSARVDNAGGETFPCFLLPQIVLDSFVVSAAVLKAHSLAGVTLAMKNMIGCAPPSVYQQGGYWKKSAFHARMHAAIFELNRCRPPDLCLIDASVGLAEHHLGGPACDPPVGRLVAGFDPVAVDAAGAALLGRDWRQVAHIRMADGVLGRAEAGT